MQVSVNQLSPVLVELDVLVDVERVKTEMNKYYTELARTARVRGFRPGKAPRRILKTMFGARVAADVAQKLVDETYQDAIGGQDVQPVANPQIEPNKLKENEPFSYKARVEIVPKIEDVSYDGLEAEKPSLEVTDALIDEELEKIRDANSTLEPPKKARKVEKDDFATIDFTVSVGDKVIDDVTAEDFQVQIGGGTLLPAIEEALLGADVGSKHDVDVEMPDTHQHPDLAGKTATFHVTLKDLKEKVLPELDDEFAKDIGEYEDLAGLKKELETQLAAQLKDKAENAIAEQLVQKLVERNPIPVPPTLVERQGKITEQEIVQQARRQGKSAGQVGPELRQRIAHDSEVKVRAGLLMAEIAKAENIQIGDEQIEEGLKELAEQTGKNIAKLRAEYSGQSQREMLVGMILENKVLDIIEAKAKITDAGEAKPEKGAKAAKKKTTKKKAKSEEKE